MAGPTSSILLPSVPSDKDWEEIRTIIRSISESVDGDDFYAISTTKINGSIASSDPRPFGIEEHKVNAEYFNYSSEEISKIEGYVGFKPIFDLVFYAMSKSATDHRILGELTLFFAQKFNGIIDFGGKLENCKENLTGNIWEIPYETTKNTTSTYNVGDLNFMKSWLANSHFTMIK